MFGRSRRKRELKSRLFGEMMRRFDLNEHGHFSLADEKLLRVAAAHCTHCQATEQCMAWLAHKNGIEGAFEFCPNAGAFADLASRPRPAEE